MKRSINILVGLLVAQVGIYMFLTYRDLNRVSTAQKAESLMTLEFDKVEKVLVESSEKKIELVKKEGRWVIPSLFDFPVSQERVDKVLKHLVEAKRTWPLGNTKAAAKQFEVSDEKFERKLSFYVGGKVEHTLYLGNSPSFQKVYARIDQDEKTYSIEFNTVDTPMTAKEWGEQGIYRSDRSKIASIKFKDFTIKKDGSNFVVEGLKSDEVTNNTEAEALISKIQSPQFEDVLASGTYDSGAKILDYTITLDDKSERLYTFFAMKPETTVKVVDKKDEKTTKDEFALLKVSNLPFVFKVHKYRVDELLKFHHASFVKKKDASEKKTIDFDKEAGQVPGVNTKG